MKYIFLLCSMAILASVSVALSAAQDDQLIQQALKNSALAQTGKLDVSRFKSYSTAAQAKFNNKVNKTTTVNGQPLSSNVTITTITGNAGTATGLAGNGTNCSPGQAAQGIDTGGNAEGCFTPTGTYVLPQATTSVLGGAKPDGTSLSALLGVLSVINPLNQNTTGSAATLTTGRTIGITGPITWTSPNFNGSMNVTAAATVTSQTGTGSKFVMDTSPALVTPDIGSATARDLVLYGSSSTVNRSVDNGSLQLQGGTSGSSGTAVIGVYGKTAATPGRIDIYADTLTINKATSPYAGYGSAGKAICWKTAGTLGYCSTVVAADGSCTCN